MNKAQSMTAAPKPAAAGHVQGRLSMAAKVLAVDFVVMNPVTGNAIAAFLLLGDAFKYAADRQAKEGTHSPGYEVRNADGSQLIGNYRTEELREKGTKIAANISEFIAERDALRADNERLRAALRVVTETAQRHAGDNVLAGLEQQARAALAPQADTEKA